MKATPAVVGMAVCCYPSWWRETYEEEVLVLSADLRSAGRPAWRIAASLGWGAADTRLRGTGIPNVPEIHRRRARAAMGVGIIPLVALMPFILLLSQTLNRFALFSPGSLRHCTRVAHQSAGSTSITTACGRAPSVPAAHLAALAGTITGWCALAGLVVALVAYLCASRPVTTSSFRARSIAALGAMLLTGLASAALLFDWSPNNPTSVRTWLFWGVLGAGWGTAVILSIGAAARAHPQGRWLRLASFLTGVAALTITTMAVTTLELVRTLPDLLHSNPGLASPLGAWWPILIVAIALATVVTVAGALNAIRFGRSARRLEPPDYVARRRLTSL